MKKFIDLMLLNNIQVLVWTWEGCPFDEKYELSSGGDEDYVILYDTNFWKGSYIVENLTICDNESKEFGNFTLAVTCHA